MMHNTHMVNPNEIQGMNYISNMPQNSGPWPQNIHDPNIL